MGAADCITAVMSNAQHYNMHNMHIKTQLHKYICIPICKHTINKREPKSNTLAHSTHGDYNIVNNFKDKFIAFKGWLYIPKRLVPTMLYEYHNAQGYFE